MLAAVFFSQTSPVSLSVTVPSSWLVYRWTTPALTSPSCPVPAQSMGTPAMSTHVVCPVASSGVGGGGAVTVQPPIATPIVDAPSLSVPMQPAGTLAVTNVNRPCRLDSVTAVPCQKITADGAAWYPETATPPPSSVARVIGSASAWPI